MESISFLSGPSLGSEQDYGGQSAQCPLRRETEKEKGGNGLKRKKYNKMMERAERK